MANDPDQFCSYKFFICEKSDCIPKSGVTQSFKSTGWIRAKGCSPVHKHSKHVATDEKSLNRHPDSRNQTDGEICESLVIPTEIPNANTISQSSTSLVQVNLLQEYERKFAELPDDQKLSKPCSDDGFLKEMGKDNSSLQLKKDLRSCRQHVENTHNLEISKHPDREGGFVRIRKSAQSWM